MLEGSFEGRKKCNMEIVDHNNPMVFSDEETPVLAQVTRTKTMPVPSPVRLLNGRRPSLIPGPERFRNAKDIAENAIKVRTCWRLCLCVFSTCYWNQKKQSPGFHIPPLRNQRRWFELNRVCIVVSQDPPTTQHSLTPPHQFWSAA